MSKDPAFLFYSKDWLEGTAEYMPDEKGVYIDLLCYQHQRGSLPTDINRLAKMVGLSDEYFLKIWSVISVHFERTDNRLVNRKLSDLMTERLERGRINTITGTFAALLRLGGYNKTEFAFLKKCFKVSEFNEIETERLTERLTEWISDRLKSIGDVNKDADYVLLFNKVISDNNLILSDEFKSLILEWLKYKSEKRQTYKETGLKSLLIKVMQDTGGNAEELRKMILYSTSKNYDGLFKEKDNGVNKKNTGATPAEIAGAVGKHFASDREGNY
jgi:hypothetical protein